jgi:PIN domain nuclease of toxin-antitoxin system
VHWWASEPRRLSRAATRALTGADELAVASISWFELAWLAQQGRITLSVPIHSWLEGLATQLVTAGTTPSIAATAAALPASFPRDPSDRLIYATAIERGWSLVTRDERLRGHPHPRNITIW